MRLLFVVYDSSVGLFIGTSIGISRKHIFHYLKFWESKWFSVLFQDNPDTLKMGKECESKTAKNEFGPHLSSGKFQSKPLPVWLLPAQIDLKDIQRSIILQELISYSVGQRTLLSSCKFKIWDESNRPRK